MNFTKNDFGKTFLVVVLVVVLCCIIIKPSIYMQATYKGIMVWATCVLPALFPFFFLTTLLCELNVVDKLALVTKKPLQKLFNVSSKASIVYLMSLISGYPVGAKLISELYENHQITKTECLRMHAFCSTSGPIFIVGTVGSSMFANSNVGLIILCVHLLGSALNGILYRKVGLNKQNIQNTIYNPNQKIDNLLGKTIYQSVISVLIVGGYIALAFLFCEFLVDSKILNLLCIPLNKLFNICNISPHFSDCIVLGIAEITRGCLELSSLFCAYPKLVFITACGLISFGGISVMLQSMTYLSKCDISTKTYLLQKTTQAIITMFIAFIISFLI
ncbi:MAG: hypothetical protein IJU58_00440 [Clostridia bacterium]|nr:hypothetical protein [Clostridia bacterium]